eukprot:1955912-Alexandrium_andersonii.AAC.1
MSPCNAGSRIADPLQEPPDTQRRTPQTHSHNHRGPAPVLQDPPARNLTPALVGAWHCTKGSPQSVLPGPQMNATP